MRETVLKIPMIASWLSKRAEASGEGACSPLARCGKECCSSSSPNGAENSIASSSTVESSTIEGVDDGTAWAAYLSKLF